MGNGRDHYYNKAKQEGYRSRAAYKLIQLDDAAELFSQGDRVVDLGAAPGGWLQVAAEAVGADGTVVGVDFQRIDAIDAPATEVRTVQEDVTDEATVDVLCDYLPGGQADVVLSDMAPDMTGEYALDQARAAHLAEQALGVAEQVLAPGGHFVVKVFQGKDTESFRDRLESTFEYVRATSPDASRESSAELYLVGKGYVDAPVAPGDRLTLSIEDEGQEGDGIARVDGYTIFVPGTEVGEVLEAEITDVKARFGFAQRR